ncbi:MarR family winged helix-turn-helix transcriptional regulator [Allopusillimonas ginsengisoli]|uniref:MarR family winged helix-turn-helix transcriptional regulator n=1 Tax=Allopusillimonas ginsengisoli TaxID=453575 RepID=UPI00102117E4|nr:MarR family transcriptional regulator [Allopusillimonas ginsengisoli]TEA79309.1 MarR family transcriptional regulator [Allopusillimonas ginsengisoli]
MSTQDLLTRDAESLYEALNDLVRVYQFRDRGYICCYDVSVTQCYALEMLVKQGSMRLQSLAERMYLDKSTASRVVNALERKEYVVRVEDDDDRRAIRIQATAAGQELYKTIRSDLIAEERAMIEGLSPEVRQASLALLRRLTRAAEARYGERPHSLLETATELA